MRARFERVPRDEAELDWVPVRIRVARAVGTAASAIPESRAVKVGAAVADLAARHPNVVRAGLTAASAVPVLRPYVKVAVAATSVIAVARRLAEARSAATDVVATLRSRPDSDPMAYAGNGFGLGTAAEPIVSNSEQAALAASPAAVPGKSSTALPTQASSPTASAAPTADSATTIGPTASPAAMPTQTASSAMPPASLANSVQPPASAASSASPSGPVTMAPQFANPAAVRAQPAGPAATPARFANPAAVRASARSAAVSAQSSGDAVAGGDAQSGGTSSAQDARADGVPPVQGAQSSPASVPAQPGGSAAGEADRAVADQVDGPMPEEVGRPSLLQRLHLRGASKPRAARDSDAGQDTERGREP